MKILIPFLLCLIGFNAEATSGRTNSQGCHNSKKEGYHCHGGGHTSTSKPTPRSSNGQVPIVSTGMTQEEYIAKSLNNTTYENFNICAQALMERSKHEKTTPLTNDAISYSAEITSKLGTKETVICYRDHRKEIIKE